MQWIKAYCTLPTHPKVARLASRMGWQKRREAIGALIQLWEWCVVHHEDGVLEGIEPADIMFALDFTAEEAARFLQALKECRLLDENPMRLHDWWNYVGQYIETKYHNTDRKRIKEIARIYGKENLRMVKDPPQGASKEGLISPSSSASPSSSGSCSNSRSIAGSEGKKKRTGMKRINDRDQNGQPPLPMTHEEKIAGLRQALREQGFVKSLNHAFPRLDVDVQEKRMIVWIMANPELSNRQDWQRFIQNWFAQETKPPKWLNSSGRRRNR